MDIKTGNDQLGIAAYSFVRVSTQGLLEEQDTIHSIATAFGRFATDGDSSGNGGLMSYSVQ